MPQGEWSFAVHEDGNPAKQIIGAVLFSDDKIVGFISHFDFKDTNLDGDVSWGESFFASVGFGRSIFVSTAIKELTGAIADPNGPVFDYQQIQSLRYANMMQAAMDVGTEALLDAAVGFLVDRFAGNLISGIVSQFTSNGFAQVMLTSFGQSWLTSQMTDTVLTLFDDSTLAGRDVRYISDDAQFDQILNNSGGTTLTGAAQVVYAADTTRDVTTGDADDLVVIGAGGTSRVEGGLGYDTVIYDRLDQSAGQTIAEFGYGVAGGVELFDGTRLIGVERIGFGLGRGNDKVTLRDIPDGVTIELDLGAGDDTMTLGTVDALVQGGAGVDTLTVDFRDSPYVLRLNNFSYGDWVYPNDLVVEDRLTLWIRELDPARSFSQVTGAWASGVESLIVYGSEGKDIINTYAPLNDYSSVAEWLAYSPYEINDTIYAGGGDDRISCGRGVDFVDGGAGYDLANVGKWDATVAFNVDASFTTAAGLTLSDETHLQNIEILLIRLGAGNDVITNLGGNLVMSQRAWMEVQADAGDDQALIVGADVGLTVYGEEGFDTIVIDLSALANSVSMQLHDSYGEAFSSIDINDIPADPWITPAVIAQHGFSGFESVTIATGSGSDVLHLAVNDYLVLTGAGNDQVYGGGGNDRIFGEAGDDILRGGAGIDQLYGGQGDDTYEIEQAGDLAFENEGEGVDTILAFGNQYLYANIENISLFYASAMFNATGGDFFAVGNELDNIIIGNDGSNLLIGGAGDDEIRGIADSAIYQLDKGDALFGEGGNDRLFGDEGVDYLVGGSGIDTLDGGDDADALYGEDGDDVLFGGHSFDTDILVGGGGNDLLNGTSAQANPDYDLMDGGTGNDTYIVDTGADLTFEAADGGIDTVYAKVWVPNAGVYLYAYVENLVLEGITAFGVGNELANRLTGNASVNWLLGGPGDDTIEGAGGNDVLFGEGGADTFIFGYGDGADLIGDFTPGTDRIDLSELGFTWLGLQNSLHEYNGSTAIDLGNGRLVVLSGVSAEALHETDFIFG